MGIIEKIQSNFLEEAKNSPLLLSDLAHMETYIAESLMEGFLMKMISFPFVVADLRPKREMENPLDIEVLGLNP